MIRSGILPCRFVDTLKHNAAYAAHISDQTRFNVNQFPHGKVSLTAYAGPLEKEMFESEKMHNIESDYREMMCDRTRDNVDRRSSNQMTCTGHVPLDMKKLTDKLGGGLATPTAHNTGTLYPPVSFPGPTQKGGHVGAAPALHLDDRRHANEAIRTSELNRASVTNEFGSTSQASVCLLSYGSTTSTPRVSNVPSLRCLDTSSILEMTQEGTPQDKFDNQQTSILTEKSHLNESTEEVLNSSLQEALPRNYPCGPTPFEFRHFVANNWPVISGEKWLDFANYGKIYEIVRHTALPNFLAARVTIPSRLNLAEWRAALMGYHDNTLADQLEFGFPSNYSKSCIPVPSYQNHREKPEYQTHIKQYIEKECRLGALLGPFAVPPFTPWSHCSPMMTREKATPDKRRVIVDLSYPAGYSVNAGIPRREFLGEPLLYSLPTVSMVGDRLRTLGHGSYIWAADVSRAYRQLRADPLAAPLYGITFGGSFYVDIALPFGCRSSGASCVRMTSALLWMLKKLGFHGLVYVDDFIGVEGSYLDAMKAFDAFLEICKRLSIDLSPDKCQPPTMKLVWLGFYLNSDDMTIAIPAHKLHTTVAEAEAWLTRPRATRRALQQLVGRLVHICSCVKPGRRFISRILNALSRAHFTQVVDVDQDLVRDVTWFVRYARYSNGVTILPPPERPKWLIECDSCLTGGGAFSPRNYFAEEYEKTFTTRFTSIHALEAVNLVEAVATLRPDPCEGYLISVNTDNQASATSLQTGKCSDPDLGLCSRELWLMAAVNNFDIEICHKPGIQLVLADALSRAHMSEVAAQVAAQQCTQLALHRVRVSHSIDRFTTIL